MLIVRPLLLALPLALAPVAPPASATSAAAAAARPAAGPPWLSIEYPVNPYDATTRGAFLVVHAFHHGTPVAFPISGTAEGIVNGTRRSIPLTFARTSRTGAYAVGRQWPNEGTWSLVVVVRQGPEDAVSAVVDLSAVGEVAGVRIPTRQVEGHTIPAPLSMATVEASLRERASRQAASRTP